MKLGLGLYRESVTDENLRFARQAGATHIVVHMVNYFRGKDPSLTSGDDRLGWGLAGDPNSLWDIDELSAIKRRIESHGLIWEAIENFDPAHWHDVLLDGPKRDEQLANLATIIRRVGQVGIPTIGYNFSLAGVWGWTRGSVARGDAVSVAFDATAIDPNQPIPNGMVWNMVYDPDALPGNVPSITEEDLWARLEVFLKHLVPVAADCGVRLAAHPDDPPVERLRNTPRLVNQPGKYQRLLDLVPSQANALEFCLGSLQEMMTGNVYQSTQKHAEAGDIAYIHFRNVRGKVPHYQEVFVDEGDLDMPRIIRILREADYQGVLIPDHTPEMDCGAPWHAGMSFALGYMRGLLDS